MGREDVKPIDSQRAATVETINADLQMVRGLNKVKCQALWSAPAYNLVHFAMAWIT